MLYAKFETMSEFNSWIFKSIAFVVTIVLITPLTIHAQVSGLVYKDFNANGQKDLSTEIGVANIKVDAFLESGIVLNSTTNSDGIYNFSEAQISPGTKVRIEFGNLQGQFAGLVGSKSRSTVQFVQGGNLDASLGILGTQDFCTFDNPMVLASCYVSGDPLGGGSAGEDAALVTFPYLASGLAGSGGPSPDYTAKLSEVGSVWGMSYQSSSRKYLVAALVRRHSGLGPLGTGGIYMVDAGTQTALPFLDVKTLGINTGNDPRINTFGQNIALSADKLVPNEDSLTMHTAGKLGIGSLTFSQDEKTLFFVNLYDRKLYSLEVGVPMTAPSNNSSVNSYNIPDPSGVGDFRPWAVSEKNGEIYVGVVSSGESTQNISDLKAYVFKLNQQTGTFTEVFQLPLDYLKGFTDVTDQCININTWSPWTDTFPESCSRYFDSAESKWVNFVMNPQPILSSIQFDSDGSLLLGFMDRFGLLVGYKNFRPVNDGMLYDGFIGGDILRAQYDSFSNNYTLESNGVSGNLVGVGAGNGEGPGGGEFFGDDTWIFKGNAAQTEITNGGVLVVHQRGEIMVSAMDPVNEVYVSGGMRVFDREDGSLIRSYALYSDVPGTLGKSGGVGEFKLDCGPSPIEIGNRIWNDLNKDGIQDPIEPGLDGIVLTLHDMENGGLEVGRTTSSNGGFYAFNLTNVPSLLFNRNYEIRANFNQSTITNGKFVDVSIAKNDPSNNGEERDSDGVRIGSIISISLNSGFPGKTSNSYDIGLIECSVPKLISGEELEDISICAGSLIFIDLEDAPFNASWSLKETYAGVSINSKSGIIEGLSIPGEYIIYLTNLDNSSCKDSLKISVKPKPNAGEDISICSPESSVILSPSVGGVWSALASNPVPVIINQSENRISGILQNGVYEFVYTVAGCSDTVRVERFIKPNAGSDQTICDDLTEIQLKSNDSGGTWTVSNKNQFSSQISASGKVSNLNQIGIYEFIYTLNSCSDTVKVTKIFCDKLLGTIGNFVWIDSNGNGLQDINEEPLSGVSVTLLDSQKNPLPLNGKGEPIETQVTNEFGFYQFPNLSSGEYCLQFGGIIGYELTSTSPSGNQELDSNPNPISGITGIINLSPGETNNSIDAGFLPLGSIGDFVWYDTNNNGVQDGGEGGVFGVTLNLYRIDVSNNSVFVSSTTTSIDGMYLFNNLVSGKYFVELGTNIPTNYEMGSIINAGSDDEKDNDFDKNTRRSEIIQIDTKTPSQRDILSIDAGIVTVCKVNCVEISISKNRN